MSTKEHKEQFLKEILSIWELYPTLTYGKLMSYSQVDFGSYYKSDEDYITELKKDIPRIKEYCDKMIKRQEDLKKEQDEKSKQNTNNSVQDTQDMAKES